MLLNYKKIYRKKIRNGFFIQYLNIIAGIANMRSVKILLQGPACFRTNQVYLAAVLSWLNANDYNKFDSKYRFKWKTRRTFFNYRYTLNCV